MALIDLQFADQKTADQFDCVKCRKNPVTARTRRCEEPGFTMLEKRPMRVGSGGTAYPFCPGKATWYPELREAYDMAETAYVTGILPDPGGLLDQRELFADVFPEFVKRYREKVYQRVWGDVTAFARQILDGFSGKKG